MKRVTAFLLCFVMLFSLCACGEETREEEDVKETKRVPKAVGVMLVTDRSTDLGFSISSSELEMSQKLVEECIVMLKSNRVMDAVAETYGQRKGVVPLTATYIRSLFTFEATELSGVLHVTAMCPEGIRTEEELVWLCEDLLATAPSIIGEAMNDIVNIDIIDSPAIEYVTVEI